MNAAPDSDRPAGDADDPGRRNREEHVFLLALALPPSRRAAYLDQACHDDAALRNRVEALLALNKRTGQLVAEDDANIGPRVFHGQWSSPSTGRVHDRQLIFFGGGDGVCCAFDALPSPGPDGPVLKQARPVESPLPRTSLAASRPHA